MLRKTLVRHPFAVAALAALVAGPAFADSSPGLKAGTYQIDTGHTYGHFAIDHMGLSTLRGRIDVTGGTVKIGDRLSNSQIDVTLDPSSVDTGNKARDKHLRDMAGFFDVSKYPKMTFKSTKVTFDSDDADEAKVEGQLTMHGVTRPVTLDVDHINCRPNPLKKSEYTCGFNAETTIQRSNFGMNAFPKLVGDQVKIELEVEADKPISNS